MANQSNPNYPSTTGRPSGGGRGNIPKSNPTYPSTTVRPSGNGRGNTPKR